MKRDFMFTSESVTEGHPDKLCDRISDAIVDQFLRHDPLTRVVTECAVATAIFFIAERFESDALIDFTKIARQVIKQPETANRIGGVLSKSLTKKLFRDSPKYRSLNYGVRILS